MVPPSCNRHTQKVGAGGSKCQGYLWLHSKFGASLGYRRPCLINVRNKPNWPCRNRRDFQETASPFREEFPVWGSGLGAFEQLPQILCGLRYRDRLAPDHTVVLKFYSMPSTAALSLPYPFQHWLTAAPAAATGSPRHWDEVFIPISPPSSPTVAGSHSGYSQFPEQRCVRTSR